jgi:hypothetical protein
VYLIVTTVTVLDKNTNCEHRQSMISSVCCPFQTFLSALCRQTRSSWSENTNLCTPVRRGVIRDASGCCTLRRMGRPSRRLDEAICQCGDAENERPAYMQAGTCSTGLTDHVT